MSAILPGLCSVTFRELTTDEVIDLAAEAGIVGIEWGADVHVQPGDLDTARTVAERSAAAGVACPSYGTYLGARSPITDRVDVEAACRTAESLGATNLRVWAQLGVQPDADETDRAEVTSGIAVAAEVAADHGLTVGVEFHHGTLTETADSAIRLLTAIGAPNLFSYWQPNFWTEDPHDIDGQIAEMRAVRPHLSHLHTFWWLAKGERQPLIDGAAMWSAVLADAETTVNSWTEDRYAFMEFVADDDPEQFRRDAATLLGWLAG